MGENVPGLPPSCGARSPHTFFTSLKLCEIGRDVALMFVQSGLLCFTQMSVPVRPQLAELGDTREQETLVGREVAQGHFYYPGSFFLRRLFTAPAPLVTLTPGLTHLLEVRAQGGCRASLTILKEKEGKREVWRDR